MEQTFLEAISRHIKEKMAIQKSHYDFSKCKWHLVNLIALRDEMTVSMGEGRTANVFYFVFTKAFCKTFHLSL